jgi:ornithine carbamoyltransferase
MRHLLRLSDWSVADLRSLFAVADRYRSGEGERLEGAAVLFFPPSSLRTRVSFERGASLMGLQPITFPPETLNKDEDLVDVVGYLASWARLVVARYPDIAVLDGMAGADALPVINAMTDVNHPCEVLSDLYALSQDADPVRLRYVFVGADGNIGRAWWEAAQAFGLDILQTCPEHLRIPGMPWDGDLGKAVATADVIITDGPGAHATALAPYQITGDVLRRAPRGVRLAPCPPFVRGREVSADAIDHPAFVGYRFKQSLMPVQQAVMLWALQG